MLITVQISTPNAQVWHLINMLQAIIKIPSHLIGLFQGINDVCTDDQAPLMSVRKHKYIIASEVSSKDEVDCFSIPVFQCLQFANEFTLCACCMKSQNEVSTKLKRCTRCMAVAYCSRECQMKHWQTHSKVCNKDLKMPVGLPFFITLRKDLLTFENLEEQLRDRAKYSTECTTSEKTKAEYPPDSKSTLESKNMDTENKRKSSYAMLNCRCSIKVSSKININDDTCVQLNNENFSVDLILKATCLILEWQNSSGNDEEETNDVKTREVPVHEVFDSECTTSTCEEEQCSLYDCLKLFMEPERLDQSESW